MMKTDPKFTSEQILKIKDKRIATLEYRLDAMKRENKAQREVIGEQAEVVKRLNERGVAMMNRDSARYRMTEELREKNSELIKTNEKLMVLSK
jgi:hypothetical protein